VTARAGRRLLIVGAGAHARAVADVARACGWSVIGFLGARAVRAGTDVIGSDDDLQTLAEARRFDAATVGVGNTALGRRPKLFARLSDLRLAAPALVHPSAVISPSVTIGDGSVVFPLVVAGADAIIGENVVLYSGTIVEHDCRIADHAYLSPGVVLCGNVRVETGAFVGAGAIAVPGVTIPKDAVVPAGARVTESR
jgi:UDP-perosamine 4-acetyltransferase